MNDEKIKRLITLYESIIHGDKEKFGLFSFLDAYYEGCWDDLLAEVETIKDELNKNDGESDDPGTDVIIDMGR
jgi:hypothetical protein